jgi:hypothetical protein
VVQSNQGSEDDVLVYKHQEPHHHLLFVNHLDLPWRSLTATGLAVEHELAGPVLERGLDNPRVSAGPIMAVAGEHSRPATQKVAPRLVAARAAFAD